MSIDPLYTWEISPKWSLRSNQTGGGSRDVAPLELLCFAGSERYRHIASVWMGSWCEKGVHLPYLPTFRLIWVNLMEFSPQGTSCGLECWGQFFIYPCICTVASLGRLKSCNSSQKQDSWFYFKHFPLPYFHLFDLHFSRKPRWECNRQPAAENESSHISYSAAGCQLTSNTSIF